MLILDSIHAEDHTRLYREGARGACQIPVAWWLRTSSSSKVDYRGREYSALQMLAENLGGLLFDRLSGCLDGDIDLRTGL
jgi:hypothetical protein